MISKPPWLPKHGFSARSATLPRHVKILTRKAFSLRVIRGQGGASWHFEKDLTFYDLGGSFSRKRQRRVPVVWVQRLASSRGPSYHLTIISSTHQTTRHTRKTQRATRSRSSLAARRMCLVFLKATGSSARLMVYRRAEYRAVSY